MEREARGEPGQASEDSWSASTHQERVRSVQAKIQEKYTQFPEYPYGPEWVIRDMVKDHISNLWLLDLSSEEKQQRRAFWEPILGAWSLITYSRYKRGSEMRIVAGNDVGRYTSIFKAKSIHLSDTQVLVLDSLSDAVGLNRRSRQKEIPIPRHLSWKHD